METADRTAATSCDQNSHDSNENDALVDEQQQQQQQGDDQNDEGKDHNEKVQPQLQEEDSTLNGTSLAGGISQMQKEWFEDVAGPAARDAMTALQLDYRFDCDTFAGTWWVHLQNLGFVHRYNGGGGGGSTAGSSSSAAAAPTKTSSASSGTTLRAYQLPTTGLWAVPQQGDDKDRTYYYYDASGIYEELDSLAIPQVTSAFDPMPLSRDITVMSAATKGAAAAAMTEWWRSIRNELIFRRFHKEIEREYGRCGPISSKGGKKKGDGDEDPSRRSKRPKRSTSSRRVTDSSSHMAAPTKRLPHTKNKINGKDNKRNSKDQRNGGDENNINHGEVDESESIEFPTLDEYLAARQNLQSTSSFENNQQQQQLFSEWRFILGSHCSLLLYGGGGSKRSFVNQFASEELSKDGDVITVNGFDPRATIEGILQLLIDHWFAGHDPSTTFTSSSSSLPLCYRSGSSCGTFDPSVDSSVVDKAILIARRVSRIVSQASLRPVYIVLHNIDGINLRNKTAQRALAALVDESRTIVDATRNIKSGLCAIRLVTTIDHINAPLLLWDTFTRHRFQFVWKEVPSSVTTRYVEELACDDGTIRDLNLKSATRRRSSGGNSRQLSSAGLYGVEAESTEESIFGVLTSLASRHAQVLQQLAQLQLKSIATLEEQDQESLELSLSSKRTKKEREAEENKSWIPYTDLLRQCRHQFIVANDSQLRSYIGELLDHSIVEQRSSSSTRGGNRGRASGGSAIGSSSYRIPHSIHILDMIIDFDPANDDKI